MHKHLTAIVVSAASLLLIAATARAHHAFSSEFDAARPIELRGVVTRMEWINPHSWITIDVTNEDGSVETWEIEAGAPNAMFRRGFTTDSLPVNTWWACRVSSSTPFPMAMRCTRSIPFLHRCRVSLGLLACQA